MDRSRWRNRARLGVRLVILSGLLVATYSCSSRTKVEGDHSSNDLRSSRLSPDQCAAGAQIQRAAEVTNSESGYLIQPGDVLNIEFYLNPEFNEKVTVRPDGQVTLRIIGDVKAWGLTPDQLAAELDQGYRTELRSPDAVVHVKNMPNRQVYVEGQVQKPGAFPLEGGMTTVQAVSAAGGLTDDAANQAILVRRDACGQPAGISVDLKDAMENPENSADVALMPRDVIIVPRSRIANMDLFVKQYVQNLLPIPPYLSLAGPAI